MWSSLRKLLLAIGPLVTFSLTCFICGHPLISVLFWEEQRVIVPPNGERFYTGLAGHIRLSSGFTLTIDNLLYTLIIVAATAFFGLLALRLGFRGVGWGLRGVGRFLTKLFRWLRGSKVKPPAINTPPVKLNMGAQGKHIPGHNNYIPGRSIWTHPEPQKLLDQWSGKGTPIKGTFGQPGYKERVDFGEIIGDYVEPGTGTRIPTTKGIIHYSSNGAHIIPARP